MKTVNMNDKVWVRLNEIGWDTFDRHHAALTEYNIDPADFRRRLEEKEVNGWVPFHLWELMQIFGPVITMGLPTPFEENRIRFLDEGETLS